MMLNKVSLNTIGLNRIGLNRIGKPSRASSDRPYIDPEVLASLKAVCICYGKSNDDPDRAVVKNLVDPDNPFVISNATFKLNSGFGGFVEDFTSWDRIDSSTAEISNDGSKIKCINTTLNVQYLFNSINRDIPSFKVKISNFTKGDITYYYRKEDGIEEFFKITPLSVVNSDKVIELPKSYNTVENGTGGRGGFYSSNINIGVTITQIPSFEGAFVTDGIDDLITSTKTVQEMLGGSNEITVVSMIHQIGLIQVYGLALTNYIRNNGGYLRSAVNSVGKTGIYGYTANNLNQSIKDRVKVINTILGDKKDYTASISDSYVLDDSLFHVQNYVHDGIIAGDGSQLAWYWTIIANKVLTTDQINQVIAYFNLDRTLNPDILCNTIKQGITNENHAEFGDKLIDYSGNGRDIQLNNIGWDGDSGIGKYNYPNWKVNVTQGNKYARIVYYDSINGTYSADFKGITDLYKSYGLSVEIRVNRANTIDYHSIKEDGIYTVTPPDDTTSIDIRFGGENVYNASCDITITQIPSHAGALRLDGINDFGKVTGMPVYKDYTVIADYERFYLEPITGGRASILSKSSKVGDGSFIFNLEDQDGGKACYTFGEANGNISDDITRIIRYQSKYYNTKTLSIGTAEDNDFMVLGKVREVDSRYFCGAIYSLMTFPYSMSEFLIERQLKKHKLGTLYPDMVEFRPIVNSNVKYQDIIFRNTSTGEDLVAGQYYDLGTISIFIKPLGCDEATAVKVNNVNAEFNSYDKNTGYYRFDVVVTKSPQKIDITIYQPPQYLTMLSNSTLISNETLIKNE